MKKRRKKIKTKGKKEKATGKRKKARTSEQQTSKNVVVCDCVVQKRKSTPFTAAVSHNTLLHVIIVYIFIDILHYISEKIRKVFQRAG